MFVVTKYVAPGCARCFGLAIGLQGLKPLLFCSRYGGVETPPFRPRNYVSAHRHLGAPFHHGNELIEQVAGIVRPGRRLGVILHAEERRGTMAQTFVRIVIRISGNDATRRKRIGVHANCGSGTCDLDLARMFFYDDSLRDGQTLICRFGRRARGRRVDAPGKFMRQNASNPTTALISLNPRKEVGAGAEKNTREAN